MNPTAAPDVESNGHPIAPTGRVEVLSEPLTYQARLIGDSRSPRGLRAISPSPPRSYVRDLAIYERRTGDWQGAGERLERHGREMRDLAKRREALFAPDVIYDFESRAINWATGTGGYFAPPLWIIEQFARTPSPERVLSAETPSFELPQGAQSVSLPRWTTGANVGVVQPNAGVGGGDIVDVVVSSAVVTIAGNADVPLQMLEQSPVGAHLDWAVFTNMEGQYGYVLEQQMIAGAGPTGEATRTGNQQLLGILNTAVPTANIGTYTSGSPSVKDLVESTAVTQGGPLAALIAAVGNNRKVKPEMWLMTTSRAAWLSSGEISFPMSLTNQTGPGAFDLLAYPVKQDDAIPTTLGATANQDTIILCRPSDWLILESEPRTGVYTETLSGQLMARIQMRRYVAAMNRYPSGTAYLQGTGMVIPAGF